MSEKLTDAESFVLLAAVRYACGRETYAPGIVIGEVRRLMGRVPPNDRATMARDIREYDSDRQRFRGDRTDAFDDRNWNREGWMRLADDLEAANA